MLALCLMLSETYYAQNYAGIISLGLHPARLFLLHMETGNKQYTKGWP